MSDRSARPGGRRRRAGLSPDDRAVWETITRQVRPLDPARGPVDPEGESPAAPAPNPAPDLRGTTAIPPAERPATSIIRPVLPRRLSGRPTPSGVTLDLHDPAPAPVGRPEAGLDRRTAERLRRGDRAPDARIDLHGMTAERAHRALDGFILDAAARGLRCVLVITGKGGRQRDPDGAGFMRPDRGVLRQDAPRWLRAGPAAGLIVGIYAAHRRHGGEGAFYVYLKKRRP